MLNGILKKIIKEGKKIVLIKNYVFCVMAIFVVKYRLLTMEMIVCDFS